jgi:hypothetical protein
MYTHTHTHTHTRIFKQHLPHLALRLKKEYNYTSTPLWPFMACYRVNFTLAFCQCVSVIMAAAVMGVYFSKNFDVNRDAILSLIIGST